VDDGSGVGSGSEGVGDRLRVGLWKCTPLCSCPYLALRAAGTTIPYYTEMSIYAPRRASPHSAGSFSATLIDLIHLTTPGPVGITARYLAARARLNLVGSFHTHLADYARLLSGSELAATAMRHYLRWVYRTCDPVMVPSEDARRRLIDTAGRPIPRSPRTSGRGRRHTVVVAS
jgi:Glycosyltransferase Family 4